MPFVRMPGIAGKVYIPGVPEKSNKKHPCPDCFSCEHCSDDRCRVCRKETISKEEQKKQSSVGPGSKKHD